jgi:predicted PurR-regulated permease PerM
VVPDLVRETERLINEMPKDVETLRVKADDFLEHSPLGRRLPALWRLFAAQQKNASNAPGAAVATNFPPIYIQSPETNALTTNSVSPGGEADTWKQAWQSPVGGTVLRHVGDVLSLVLKWLLAQLGKVRTWAEFVLGFILMPLFLFYFLREKEAIAERWTDYLPVRESRVKEEMVFVLKSLNDCMIVFFRGQVLVALCVGTLLAIGYLSMGLNYAVLLGLVAATLGVIPYVGAIVTLVLALSVATVQFGDWGHPLLVLGIAATVKLLEDFVISPKIIGDRSGLHPLTIIIAVLVGTTVLGGVLGALFAIPLTAVLRTLMFRYVWKERGPAPGRAQTG